MVLLAELKRLNPATPAVSQGVEAQWLSIESAPKDGRAILVTSKRLTPQLVRWMISTDKGAPKGDWFVGGYDGPRIGLPVTHWMPLPSPPTESLNQGAEIKP